MKFRLSADGPHIRSTSASVSASDWFSTAALAMVAGNDRKSLEVTPKPRAFKVYETTPLPEKASSAVRPPSSSKTAASSGMSWYLDPMYRSLGKRAAFAAASPAPLELGRCVVAAV